MSVSIKCTTYLIIFLIVISSCTQRSEQLAVIPNEQKTAFNLDAVKLPPPLEATYIDPDSISPPMVMPLKGQPKVINAHPNVHPLITPMVVQIPNDLDVITLGQNGVPLPKTIPAKGKIVPAKHRKRITAGDFRTKDAAIYNIQFLSDEQGLNYGSILTVMEDTRGHMWLGTVHGSAFRFDGENLFEYTAEEGMLVHGGLKSIIEDSKGNIWFGGYGGLCYYDGQSFVQFTEKEGLGENYAGAVMEDSKGNIWFSSKDLYRYDGEHFTIYEKDQAFINEVEEMDGGFVNKAITQIMEDSRGHLWLATAGSGVFRFDGQHIINLKKEDGLVDNFILPIREDSQGHIWFGSGGQGIVGKGVSRYTPDLSSPYIVNGTMTNYNTTNGLSGNRVEEILEDASGNIWFATYEGGICQFDGKIFTHFTKEEGMSFNGVLGLTLDSKGNLWAATNGGGISKLKPNSFRHFTEGNGLEHYPVNPQLEDQYGNIWFGHWYGGVLKYDGAHFMNFTKENGLKQNITNQIMEDRDGNLWFAYRDQGISKFDGKYFTHYTLEQGMGSNSNYDIHEDRDGLIWVSAGYESVTRLNPKTGQVTHFLGNTKEGMAGSVFFEDKQQNLWFGGQGYLAKYDKDNDQIKFVCQIDTVENEWVEYMIEDENENLWFSTPSTIAQIKKDGAELKEGFPRYSKGKELPDIFMNSLTYDNDGNLWSGSANSGIVVFVDGMENIGQPDFKWLQYGKADGLKSRHYKLGNDLLDSKNRLWWGHTFGTTMLDLNNFRLPTVAPNNLDLSYIEVQQNYIDYPSLSDTSYRNTFDFGGSFSRSFDSVAAFKNYPPNLTLPYDLNHLTFHFSADDWSAPNQIRYSYKIDGIDPTWSHPSTEAKADYRNLPYGTFTFEAKAIGEAKVWSEPFTYTFSISPPWWHTWWAYSLYAVLGIAVFGGYVIRLRQKVKRKQEQLEREQNLNIELQELNIATSRFVPRDFVQILNKENLKELKLGDQTEATMTVLFADIRDYTSISEKLTPEENFEFINNYLGEMGPIIQKHGGFICQYFGDGFMALFKENHNLALEAANEMQKALQVYNRKSLTQDQPVIKVGVGLNTGKLMLGVIGDEQRFDTTVISDAVNTASRIEGLTKIFGCAVIASETTLIQSQILTEKGNDNMLNEEFRYLGKVIVKGKERMLKLYDFYGGASEEVRRIKSETKNAFEKAIQLYYGQEFGKAAELFKVIIGKYPDDVAAKYYLDKSVKYIIDGVDEKWSGVERMVSK